MKYNGAEIIIKLIEREGIKTISGIPGGANLPIYDALAKSKIKHVLARHEQGSAFIAHGQARSTGKTAVCLATSGPGATNLITAIADAKMDSVPLIAITGQVPSGLKGTDAFQEVDTCSMTKASTKANFYIKDAVDLLTIIPKAFNIANSGRPGPVVIDVPKDIQLQEIEFEQWPEKAGLDHKTGADKCFIQPEKIKKAADLINSSKRPVLFIGGGAVNCEKSYLIKKLSEKNSIPVATSLMGIGAIATDHPNYLGMLGMHGQKFTNLIVDQADLFIALGVRFDDRATGKVSEFCKGASIIHIDIDPSEIDKIKPTNCAITSDIGYALERIIPLIKSSKREDWVNFINGRRGFAYSHTGNNISDLFFNISEVAEDDAIITTDVGQHQMWTAQYYPIKNARTFLTSGGLGTMGFGLPAAIGAAIENPEKQVICFSGDGSILMNIQELATLRELNLNIKVLILNNKCLGLVRQQQELFYDKKYCASIFEYNPDLTKIAQGFGIDAQDMSAPLIAKEDLINIFSNKSPAFINISIDADNNVFPMVAPGSANTEMIDGNYCLNNLVVD